jgi:glycerophosphoryl diester phosphodiesterase
MSGAQNNTYDPNFNAPLVFAHRGASDSAPENTISAFQLARQIGAHGIELDTSLTRDGTPVVIHDLKVDKTTDGTGLVAELSLTDIKALDAGCKFSPDFIGEQVPTLDEALEVIGPDLQVNVELKSESWRSNGLEQAVLDVIRRQNAKERVIVSSFNPFALRRFRALAPGIPIGYLYSSEEPFYLRERWLMIGLKYEALHPHHSYIDAAYMASAKRHGYYVNTWTVDDPVRMMELAALGVDVIITNKPYLGLRTLGYM